MNFVSVVFSIALKPLEDRSWNRTTIMFGLVWFMVFNTTFNNISAISWR